MNHLALYKGDDALPTRETIRAAAAEQLPVLCDKIEKALAVPTPPDLARKFVTVLAVRTKRPNSMEDPATAPILIDALINLVCRFPPAILDDVMQRAVRNTWTPVEGELEPMLIEAKRELESLLRAAREEQKTRAEYARREAQRKAELQEITDHARALGIDAADMLAAWGAAERHLDDIQQRQLREGIGEGSGWACEMVALLADANKLWPQRETEQQEQRARGALCLGVNDLRFTLGHRVRQAFHHLRRGKTLEVAKNKHADVECSNPIVELYGLLDGSDKMLGVWFPPEDDQTSEGGPHHER